MQTSLYTWQRDYISANFHKVNRLSYSSSWYLNHKTQQVISLDNISMFFAKLVYAPGKNIGINKFMPKKYC